MLINLIIRPIYNSRSRKCRNSKINRLFVFNESIWWPDLNERSCLGRPADCQLVGHHWRMAVVQVTTLPLCGFALKHLTRKHSPAESALVTGMSIWSTPSGPDGLHKHTRHTRHTRHTQDTHTHTHTHQRIYKSIGKNSKKIISLRK